MSMWTARELDKVLREFTPLGKVTKLLNSTSGMDELNGLIEDVRSAVMDYQVRPQSSLTHRPPTPASDVVTAIYLRKELSTHCKPRFPGGRPRLELVNREIRTDPF